MFSASIESDTAACGVTRASYDLIQVTLKQGDRTYAIYNFHSSSTNRRTVRLVVEGLERDLQRLGFSLDQQRLIMGLIWIAGAQGEDTSWVCAMRNGNDFDYTALSHYPDLETAISLFLTRTSRT
jgi:ketopantoate reductase